MSKGFSGSYNHTIDPKGRIIMPLPFRELLGPNFQVTKSLDNCLVVYTPGDWDAFEEKLSAIPDSTNKNARLLKRLFLGGSSPCEMDKQGRVLLPESLRTFAGLDKEIVIVGVGKRIEIWNREAWEKQNIIDDPDALSASMEQFNL